MSLRGRKSDLITSTGRKASTHGPWRRNRGSVTTTNEKHNILLNNGSSSRLYSWPPLQNQWSLAKPYHYGIILHKNYPENYTKCKISLRKLSLSGYDHTKFSYGTLRGITTQVFISTRRLTSLDQIQVGLMIFRMPDSRIEQFYGNLFYRKWKSRCFFTVSLSNFQCIQWNGKIFCSQTQPLFHISSLIYDNWSLYMIIHQTSSPHHIV
jgi:hypothetical protein